MAEMGVAMPPANSVDREAHAARIALLAQDCADLPIEHLRAAAAWWRQNKPFLPRACELREDALARARLAMHGRMIEAPRQEAPAKPAEPPLSEAEIAATPAHILKLGIALGEITPEQAAEATGSA